MVACGAVVRGPTEQVSREFFRSAAENLAGTPEPEWDLGPMAGLYFEDPGEAVALVRSACQQVQDGLGLSADAPLIDLRVEGCAIFLRAVGFRAVSRAFVGTTDGRLVEEVRVQRGEARLSLYHAFAKAPDSAG